MSGGGRVQDMKEVDLFLFSPQGAGPLDPLSGGHTDQTQPAACRCCIAKWGRRHLLKKNSSEVEEG